MKITVVPSREWDWNTCIACGSTENIQSRGLTLIGQPGRIEMARVGWCHENIKCNSDRDLTDYVGFNEQEAEEFDRENPND